MYTEAESKKMRMEAIKGIFQTVIIHLLSAQK